jgi:hypothetical protein
MPSQQRILQAVAGVGIAVLLATGCAAPEDESDATPTSRPPTTATAAPGGMGGKLPVPDASVNLDPEMKRRCDAVWSFGVFVYSAHVAVNPTPDQKDKFQRGIADNEPKASEAEPALAADVKALAVHSRAALNAPSGLPLTPDLTAANQRIVDHLRTTCKYKAS